MQRSIDGCFVMPITSVATWRWKLHRHYVRRALPPIPFLPQAGRRWLFVSEQDPICTAQVFPFFLYSSELGEQHGASFREVSIDCFQRALPYRGQLDAIFLQTWFDWSEQRMTELFDQIANHYPQAKIIYLDWFAPTDLRYASQLSDRLALYIKKNVLRERDAYQEQLRGDTNLTDYYSQRFGLEMDSTHRPVPAKFWDKLCVASSFALAPDIAPRFMESFPDGERPIDVHARIGLKGTPWYTRMRQEAQDAADALTGCRVVSGGGVSRDAYLAELRASKICFSPFGYGEICWRDYEAAFSGALLLKPDTGHVQTTPDIFQTGKTYVPLRWDLRDLQDKVRHYLSHEAERQTITRGAFATVKRYLLDRQFLADTRTSLQRIAGSARPLQDDADW